MQAVGKVWLAAVGGGGGEQVGLCAVGCFSGLGRGYGCWRRGAACDAVKVLGCEGFKARGAERGACFHEIAHQKRVVAKSPVNFYAPAVCLRRETFTHTNTSVQFDCSLQTVDANACAIMDACVCTIAITGSAIRKDN